MVRKIVAAALFIVGTSAPAVVQAYHAGCVATPAAPTCSYKAIGEHQCAGYTDSTWEVFVTRTINGTPQKVVLASGKGTIVGDGVASQVDETTTLTLHADGTQGRPLGVVTCGNTAGHP